MNWIKINSPDDLPKEEKKYLVYYVDYMGDGHTEVMWLFEWANCFDWSEHMSSFWKDHNKITHWQPLPEPPKCVDYNWYKGDEEVI